MLTRQYQFPLHKGDSCKVFLQLHKEHFIVVAIYQTMNKNKKIDSTQADALAMPSNICLRFVSFMEATINAYKNPCYCVFRCL